MILNSDLDVLLKDKKFRYIIDAIISIGTNKETGGCAEIKSCFEAIKDILDQKYTVIIETLRDLITPELLLDGTEAFSDDKLCIDGCCTFVNDICQAICTLLLEYKQLDTLDTTASQIMSFLEEFRAETDQIGTNVDGSLQFERLALAESLSVLPEKLAPSALAKEMKENAKQQDGLFGWLDCNADYVQLWVILNNLNVFVFSMGTEVGGRPSLNLSTFQKDEGLYDRVPIPYPPTHSAWSLATVILTSPTAKNVVLDKRSSVHFEKFISPDDYAAMAKAQRHLEWMKLPDVFKYALYP